MRWSKFNARFDPDPDAGGASFRIYFDAAVYAIGVFLLPFIAIRSVSDLLRLWWLFIPAVILSVAVYLTVRRLKRSSYVKKPLNLTDSD